MMYANEDLRVVKEPRYMVPKLHDYGEQMPGYPYPPGLWTNRIMGDLQFEKKLQRLLALREANAAHVKAHAHKR